MKCDYICLIETLSYIHVTMEASYVGVAGNYSPHQSSQCLRIYQRQTIFVCYQTCYKCSADDTLHGTIYMN